MRAGVFCPLLPENEMSSPSLLEDWTNCGDAAVTMTRSAEPTVLPSRADWLTSPPMSEAVIVYKVRGIEIMKSYLSYMFYMREQGPIRALASFILQRNRCASITEHKFWAFC